MNRWRISYGILILKILAAALVLCVPWHSLSAQQQEPPFTLGQILIALETKYPNMTQAEKEKYIIKRARERGINFSITDDIEAELTKAQASSELLDVLKALAEGNKAKTIAAHFRQAESFKEKGQLDEALAEYDKALKLDPGSYTTYIFRANIYQEKKKHDLALADYNRVIELKPSRDAYLLRGELYEKMGRDDEAVADFTKAIEREPLDPNAYFSRANLFSKKKLYDPAIGDYNQVIKLRPGDEKAQKGLQTVLDEKKKAADDAAATAAAAAPKPTPAAVPKVSVVDTKAVAPKTEKPPAAAGDGTADPQSTGETKSTGSNNSQAGANNPDAAPKQPPLPENQELKITAVPMPAYTPKAIKNRITGTIRLRITFLASGEIGEVTPVTQLPDGLTEQAINAAKKIKFEPARRKGVPQTVVKDLNYNFKP